MSDDSREREVKISVAPYADGSGYQATVRAYTEDGVAMFEISTVYRLESKYWPEFRAAVEDALALVSKHPIAKASDDPA